jgi:tRNA (cytosine38-C5)-methyltransferase
VDVLLASPPCQPFTRFVSCVKVCLHVLLMFSNCTTHNTRVGLKGDTADPRTKSFLHIILLLPRLKNPPTYLLVENVKGFEESETRDRLVSTLRQCQYVYQEFLLSPTEFGIPNSRLRYFLIAVCSPHTLPMKPTGQVCCNLCSSTHTFTSISYLTTNRLKPLSAITNTFQLVEI